tara:strand:+ start:237 stop:668 length:432 start_codon:yes stop_codon:yes gene_type:complete
MTEEKASHIILRIDKLTIVDKPSFGKMNSHQMICHCADFFRMAYGTKIAEEPYALSFDDIKVLKKEGKSVPAPKGFGQVEGGGTKPTNFENDKEILRGFILKFIDLPERFNFATHPIFGEMDYTGWSELAIYHLEHHLKQFNL